jgi:hypothetical protein
MGTSEERQTIRLGDALMAIDLAHWAGEGRTAAIREKALELLIEIIRSEPELQRAFRERYTEHG